MASEVQRSAVISEDGLYRYRLDRWWGRRVAEWIGHRLVAVDALLRDQARYGGRHAQYVQRRGSDREAARSLTYGLGL